MKSYNNMPVWHNTLKRLWNFLKRFIKYVWTCLLVTLVSVFVILLIYRITKWVIGGIAPIRLTVALIIGTVICGYILRDTF